MESYPTYFTSLYLFIPKNQPPREKPCPFRRKKTVNDDSVEITALESFEPSRVSRTDCPQWDKLAAAVAGTWPGCIVSPYLMVACSDSRHYGRISDRVYTFSAMSLNAEERSTIHANNERIPLDTIAKAVEFYIRLIQQL